MMTNPVPPQVLSLLEPLTFKSMYDLGNKKTDGVPYNGYFRSLGISYDAIDLNGMDGALPLDLNSEIKLAARELVSNLGTSEHVLNQEACFRNVHNLSERRMVHWVPLAKRHPRHGLYGYSVDFFIDLAEANDYEIDKLYIETSFKSWKLICCSLTKRSARDFVWREDWFLTANPSGEWGVATNH